MKTDPEVWREAEPVGSDIMRGVEGRVGREGGGAVEPGKILAVAVSIVAPSFTARMVRSRGMPPFPPRNTYFPPQS